MKPYWELTFDADGDADTARREELLSGAERGRVSDLLVFAHGWNNDKESARSLYRRFFAPCRRLAAPQVRLGYVGALRPAIRFPDEPIPDFEPSAAPAAPAPPGGPGLDAATRQALDRAFPDHGPSARPDRRTARGAFGRPLPPLRVRAARA